MASLTMETATSWPLAQRRRNRLDDMQPYKRGSMRKSASLIICILKIFISKFVIITSCFLENLSHFLTHMVFVVFSFHSDIKKLLIMYIFKIQEINSWIHDDFFLRRFLAIIFDAGNLSVILFFLY